jgi:polyisoprenyl-phosphate glycosyltransferase
MNMKKMPYISVVTATYNEQDNIELLCNTIEKIFKKIGYKYEHIIIDNNSKDLTVDKVKNLIKINSSIKLIVNNKNYGQLASPVHGIKQSTGDATILINADFQDPPELIPDLIKSWESGKKVTLLQKNKSEEKIFYKYLRRFYYWFLNKISDSNLTKNTTGSGIFDSSIVEIIKKIDDPNPYLRGLLADIGPEISLINFDQPKRIRGKSSNSFFSLLDVAILGIIKQSKMPLRFMTVCGLTIGIISFLISIIFLLLKLLFWEEFELGKAPLLIGLFAISGFQILFLGLLGEYINIVLSHVRNLPLVVEKERINFNQDTSD